MPQVPCVERRLVALIKRAAKRKGISVEVRRVILAEPLKPIKGIERMVELTASLGIHLLDAGYVVSLVESATDAIPFADGTVPYRMLYI